MGQRGEGLTDSQTISGMRIIEVGAGVVDDRGGIGEADRVGQGDWSARVGWLIYQRVDLGIPILAGEKEVAIRHRAGKIVFEGGSRARSVHVSSLIHVTDPDSEIVPLLLATCSSQPR